MTSSKTPKNKTLKKIGFASFIMMASVFASRLIGLLRESTIAWLGGANYGVDAYQIAFVIPEILNHVVASGFLSITFIPIFTHYLTSNREQEGYKVFSIILNGFGLALICIMGEAIVFAPELIKVLAPGLTHGPTLDLAVRMTRIIIPAQFFFFSGGLFMAIQFSKERFLIPALAPLIYNLGIIAGGICLYPLMGMEGFAWGVLAGAFVGSFGLQMWGARRAGLRYFLCFDLKHPDFKKYILLTLPLMLGLTMTFSTEILMKFFGSFLDEGSISAMNYALRIMFILVGFFGQAVGMASYPFLAKLASDNKLDQLNQIINKTLKFIFLVLPFSVLFMVVRTEVVAILFKRGAFDTHAVELTAGVLPYFMIGAFAFSAQTIVSRGYFAVQNTLFPALFSTVCVLLSLPLIYAGMISMGIKGVALGLSLSVALTCGLLFETWNRKTQNTEKHEVYRFFFVLVLVSSGLGAMLQGVYLLVIQLILPGSLINNLMICALMGIVFLFMFGLIGKIFHIPEIHTLYHTLFKKVFAWGKKAG
ncbi:MAG: murein biosynthesis integral membrane protein MurJ [Desulfobacter sp.]|nr:murein biosynthesis integral membrane protein MurJ [Desulfobacter sp.]WDP88115.1 MAG: murein biosynthesis integral membrane protein MurJ [Desulfobacter sp.]